MNYYPFDSRNKLYKEKIGAVAEGETLRLRVLLHIDAHPHKVFFLLHNDDCKDIKEAPMLYKERIEDYLVYECETTLAEGLYWYSFKYTSDYGDYFIVKTETSLGVVSAFNGNWWQQTVYDKDFKTPEFLKGGIIYQIFPDRFYNSGKEKKNVPLDRYICNNWEKQPEYRQSTDKLRLGNDYYGGDLKGIEEKIPYLKSLGVSCIYLNPIFEAHSNHRYNTANYLKIDPILGDEKDLESLIKTAEKSGIAIILDGVFSHTGDDSIYFNKYHRYDNLGAYESEASAYKSWFNFKDYPEKYESWWGITTLPETNECDPSFSEFITGEKGVIRHWLKKGIKGFRLDVADELPDDFLDKVRLAVKAEGDENFLLGEVWEDATNKISYDKRRRFLRGSQLDSVMNYPFANAIVEFIKTANSTALLNTVLDICENYPKCAVNLLMNHIGTHDTARILTRLGTNVTLDGNREAQSQFKLNDEEKSKGITLLKLAAVLQYTLPGVPSLYYGDEAGCEGFSDPFCRATYPWGSENQVLLSFYRSLGALRRSESAFKDSAFEPIKCEDGLFSFKRENISIFVNADSNQKEITTNKNNKLLLGELKESVLPPFSFAIIKE